MPQKIIKFSGINRSINEFQGSGACEELINIRPGIADKKVVRPKKTKIDGIEFDFHVHTFGEHTLFLGVEIPATTNDGGYYVIKIHQLNDDGSIIKTLGSLSVGKHDININNAYNVAFVGNKAVFNFADNNCSMLVYEYIDGEYTEAEFYWPNQFDLKYKTTIISSYSAECPNLTSGLSPTSEEFKAETLKQWSAMMEKKDFASELTGAAIVALNVSLDDGTELWTNQIAYVNPYVEDLIKVIYYETAEVKKFEFTAYEVEFTISQDLGFSSEKNRVKNINVYASRPVFPWDINDLREETDENGRVIYGVMTGIAKTGVANELLYFQKSIPVSDVAKGKVVFTLNFGNNQAGERVLNVDNGPVLKRGNFVSYNNRLHSFKSKSIISAQRFACLANNFMHLHDTYWRAYVYLKCSNETVILSTRALINISDSESMDSSRKFVISCCYPDARAYKILIRSNADNLGDYTQIDLVASDTYNFAYGEGQYKGVTISPMDIRPTSNVVSDDNVISVSDQYNPFSFPVDKVYSVGGSVLDIATSYLPISSTQIGQYPLTVFTTNGIYSMEQGSGTVLYGNIVPINPMIISGKATPTPYGIFFISSKGVYLLSGRETLDMSYVLNGELETNLRELDAYKILCCGKKGVFYDFSPLLSSKDFEEYITGATLTYDQLNNELLISSNDESINYSYVLNLGTKAYHKVGKKYKSTQGGARYVLEQTGGMKNIVDMHTEEKGVQPILLQSRPLSLEAFHTHIQRLILMTDAKLTDNQNLSISVFGSDNLYDWKCIISAQKHNTVLRQIRTNKAPKSYRDYIIIISGTVDTDTDISDLIADYTVVTRRLG